MASHILNLVLFKRAVKADFPKPGLLQHPQFGNLQKAGETDFPSPLKRIKLETNGQRRFQAQARDTDPSNCLGVKTISSGRVFVMNTPAQ